VHSELSPVASLIKWTIYINTNFSAKHDDPVNLKNSMRLQLTHNTDSVLYTQVNCEYTFKSIIKKTIYACRNEIYEHSASGILVRDLHAYFICRNRSDHVEIYHGA